MKNRLELIISKEAQKDAVLPETITQEKVYSLLTCCKNVIS